MFTLNATIRQNQGKSASRHLRLLNKIPAIIYGGNKLPIAIELVHDNILKIQNKKEFYRDILVLMISGINEINKVKTQAVQYHPFKLKLIHIDFIRV